MIILFIVNKMSLSLLDDFVGLRSKLKGRGLCTYKGITFEFFPHEYGIWVNTLKIERDKMVFDTVMAYIEGIATNTSNRLWLANQCLDPSMIIDRTTDRIDDRIVRWLYSLVGDNFEVVLGKSYLFDRLNMSSEFPKGKIHDKLFDPKHAVRYIIPKSTIDISESRLKLNQSSALAILATLIMSLSDYNPKWGDLVTFESGRDNYYIYNDETQHFVTDLGRDDDGQVWPDNFTVLWGRNVPLDYWQNGLVRLNTDDPVIMNNITTLKHKGKYILYTTFVYKSHTYYIIYNKSNYEYDWWFNSAQEAVAQTESFKYMLRKGLFMRVIIVEDNEKTLMDQLGLDVQDDKYVNYLLTTNTSPFENLRSEQGQALFTYYIFKVMISKPSDIVIPDLNALRYLRHKIIEGKDFTLSYSKVATKDNKPSVLNDIIEYIQKHYAEYRVNSAVIRQLIKRVSRDIAISIQSYIDIFTSLGVTSNDE